MKRYLALLTLLTVSLLGSVGAAALQQDASASQSAKKPAASNSGKSQSQERTGEEVFQANCVRCHKPPVSISPRITGTIIMHMRTRARLSQRDEQLLLKYMAP